MGLSGLVVAGYILIVFKDVKIYDTGKIYYPQFKIFLIQFIGVIYQLNVMEGSDFELRIVKKGCIKPSPRFPIAFVFCSWSPEWIDNTRV